jgi:hypothetical protein
MRELRLSDSVPQYGSFQYSISRLRERSVLLGTNEQVDDRSILTMSCDSPGVFKFELNSHQYGGETSHGTEIVTLEELLNYQYDIMELG